MAKKNRKCIVCGTEYEYCPRCRNQKKPAWMSLYHDENCKTIFNLVTNYYAKTISKSEAKKVLDKCNLSNKQNFEESIVCAINEITSAENKPVKANKTTDKVEK